MELIQYVSRQEVIMKLIHRHANTSNSKIFSDDEYLSCDYNEQYLISPPRGVKFDSSKWKDFDHYAMIGLRNVRWRATQEKIKQSYRQRLLSFHPDKRRDIPESTVTSLTSCINKSFEVLGNELKRRSYDSVDPFNDDSLPLTSEITKSNFYSIYGQAFEKNSKWSNSQPVPKFGGEKSNHRDVIAFYDFWYSFDSWREFSYLDKEDKEVGENRYQRRIIDKENKAERVANKKMESQRIRRLVDDAYQRDPRVKIYLQMKKKEKEEMRKLRKQQQRQQNAVNGHMTTNTEDKVINSLNLFAKEKANLLQNINKLKSLNISNEAVRNISDYIGGLVLDDEELLLLKLKKLNMVHSQGLLQVFKDQLFLEFDDCRNFVNGENSNWTVEDLDLLTKAINLFPSGYKDRWKHVTRYVNNKSTRNFSEKSVLKMAKDLETFGDATAFFRNSNRVNGKKKESETLPEVTWTSEEQKILEQALKTYPASTGDRWDKIAACFGNKSKTDCIDRCKEILKRIKGKK